MRYQKEFPVSDGCFQWYRLFKVCSLMWITITDDVKQIRKDNNAVFVFNRNDREFPPEL